MSNIKRTSASQVKHEFQTDSLAAASSSNAQLEGDDAATDTASVTNRLANYCQILRKTPRVSGTLRATNTAGRRDELSYQISKAGRELKRDLESSLTSGNGATAGSASGARTMAGLGAWLATNQVLAKNGSTAPTTGTTAVTTSGAPAAQVSGTAGTLLEADVKTAIASCWSNGGDPSVIMVGSSAKQTISGFSGIATQYRDAQADPLKPGSIIGAADVYVSDFSSHQIVANRFQTAGNVYLLDMQYWEAAYLRPIQTQDLSKTGDSDRKMILTEVTLASLNEKASGIVCTVVT